MTVRVGPGNLARDLAIAVLLFMIVLLMIVPLPTYVVDGLIGLNFGIAILLLITGVFLSTPLSLSALPGIILISTLFRLSLSITTTRLILADADAGAIVSSFGEVVVAGNMVVGLVVFFIITIVQFIVIAKGAERIAEVGARFTLDALPGKQMSIDAELRNGDIDAGQARAARRTLERESQFYGAMDGAMKFVKGDAIAGLIIIFVNLVGGLLVGTVQRGMSFAEAGRTYSLLTVGDALVSQIPALFVAITAAIIVTRVKGEQQSNLGTDILSQVASSSRALKLSAAALMGMALLPGFPTAILAATAGLFALTGLGVGVARRNAERVQARGAEGAAAPASDGAPASDEPERPASPPPEAFRDPDALVELRLSTALHAAIDTTTLEAQIQALKESLLDRVGLSIPRLSVCRADDLDPGAYRVTISGAPIFWAALPLEKVFVDAVFADVLGLHEVPYARHESAVLKAVLAVPADQVDALAAHGVPVRTAQALLLGETEETIALNFSKLVGIEETKAILDALQPQFPVLVTEVLRALPLQRIAEVLSRLLEERVSIHNQRLILQTLVEHAGTENTAHGLSEFCRVALKQQICAAAADKARVITAIVTERSTDDLLRESLRETGVGLFMVLEEAQAADLLGEVRRQLDALEPDGLRPVMLTSMDVRRHLRTFLKRNGLQVDVLSFQELSDDFTIVPCNTLRVRHGRIAAAQDIERRPREDGV